LFAVLLGWGVFQGKQQKSAPTVDPQSGEVVPAEPRESPSAAPVTPETSDTKVVETVEAIVPEVLADSLPPETHVAVTNGMVKLMISSRSGSISSAELFEYRSTVEVDSGPVVLNFSGRHALSFSGLPSLDDNTHYDLEATPGGAIIRRRLSSGLGFERRVSFANGYRLDVEDTFVNGGSETIELPSYGLACGPMKMIETKSQMRGISYLGLDTLAAEGDIRVIHWGKKLNGFFGGKTSKLSCARPDMRGKPFVADKPLTDPIDWVAAKNKFFVQIVAPETTAQGCDLRVSRDTSETNTLVLSSVSASLRVEGLSLKAGETQTRKVSYFVGPKKYSVVSKLGKYQGEVMQFGWWDWFRWVCRTMLWALNAFYALIPSYGVAIILVTVIIRILFWPLTHKSTDSMKRMQKIQPEINEIRQKYKENPKKMQQETMALYKVHKVNPMASCLPMVAQIPFFIALFIVLRSAVELRFAEFLWIRDLSEPEGLFAGMIPLIGSLNILPLMMTAVTVVQQRLTPSAGDPAQQKMMMFMPIIFLFLFYNMASALVLYWTVSQGLALVQLGLQRKFGKDNDPVVSADGPKKPELIAKPMNTQYPGRKKKKKR
jgi:YidC/Oxa1 family membrane protein insertase